MWVIFVLSAAVFALVALFVLYIGNKIINNMRKDNHKLEQELINDEIKKEKKDV